MRQRWPRWEKIEENLTKFPAFVRLMNDRMERLSTWVLSAVPAESAAAMPVVGAWTAGYYVENSAPAVFGAPGAQYIVKGWKRLTSSETNVLNVDWVECRTLTGT